MKKSADRWKDLALIEARRMAALPRILEGEPLSRIAESLGVSRQAVHQWARKLDRCGVAGLRRRVHGRPPKLSRDQLVRLCSLLRRGPTHCGIPSAAWTSQHIADFVAQRFGVHYGPYYLRQLLASFGWTPRLLRSKRAQRQTPPLGPTQSIDDAIGSWSPASQLSRASLARYRTPRI